jgi:hypothetical protein
MPSQVEQEQIARQAAEAERAQRKAEREDRDQRASQTKREAFDRLVKRSAEKSEQTRQELAHGENEKGDGRRAARAADAERNARLARGGTLQHARVLEQAKSFQGALTKAAEDTRQADVERIERRSAGFEQDRVEGDERVQDLDRQAVRAELEDEERRVEAQDAARPNVRIDGGGSAGADAGGSGSHGQGDDRAGALQRQVSSAKAQAARGAQPVKLIPPELLEKLASAVRVGVNEKGLHEFQIDLKDGVLSGGRLRVSVESGGVVVRFDGLDAPQRRLVEASKGDLAQRLEGRHKPGEKRLTLLRLETGP